MTITMILKKMLVTVLMLSFSATVQAYSENDREETCKKPKFTDFNLTPYNAQDNIEVPAEAEFIIKISAWIDKDSIKLTAKDQPVPFKLTSTSTFHKITAKLPASLNGQFARINVGATALLGCDDQAGWLVKVAKP